MTIFANEKKILNFIKYGAIIFVIIISFIISKIFIYEANKELELDIKKLKENYIESQKEISKRLVYKIHTLIELEKNFEFENLKKLINQEVNQAYSIANAIYNENIKKPSYSKENTIEEIKTAIREIRFSNGAGYMFIYDSYGKNILNSEYPELEGKDLWNYQDSNGTFISHEINKILDEKNETFYEWYWKKPNSDNQEYKKIGFFKRLENLNLVIGTGDYIEDFENQIKSNIINKINTIEFRLNEHIFIYDQNGICLVNNKKEIIGQNRYNIKNENGEYIVRDTLAFINKNKEGFINYNSTVKINEKLKSNQKVSYVKSFEEWNWLIGNGFYLEELDNQINEKRISLQISTRNTINKIIMISLFTTLLLIIISFYLSEFIKNILNNYKKTIEKELNKAIEKEKLLIQQSKMATMGEMIGNIAHQWKQPLNLISVSNAMLKLNQEIKDLNTKEELAQVINHIDDSVKYLSVTIDDFRDFFKPDKEKKEFNLKETFEKTFKLMNSQFKNNNIEMIKEIESMNFYGYENELLQVLINILKNAKDELVKKDEKEKKLLFITTENYENSIIIKIRDNAGGVPTEIISQIFQAYFTTKENNGGTGIGLYMSKQIIEGMNSKIEVSNKTYSYENINYIGAEFIIELNKNL